MAQLDERPFPPGEYPVVIVGTGPGGLQTSYSLRRRGISHALLSADDAPGGMFRSFPLFQRLITWTKPYALAEPDSRLYERYDWNSLIADAEKGRATVRRAMVEPTSYFPTRAEMEAGLVEFTASAEIEARFGCPWRETRREPDGKIVISTDDGEYRTDVAVFAIGMTEPWKPDIPGIDDVTHYVDVSSAAAYRGKRVFIIGKRNSGYEIANALLPYARQVVLGSPRPSRISVISRTTAAARARYLQPYEDHVLGGGHFVIDAAITRVERKADHWIVHTSGTTIPGDRSFEVDEVIAATGFTTPLQDLPDLGVQTFYQGRLPSQTPLWESRSFPGIFFAGSVTQGAIGLKKYGIPSNSAAVHGFRYNAVVLAEHIAERFFGIAPKREPIAASKLVDRLLDEATHSPELWNQQSYLARVVSLDPAEGLHDMGIRPLATFVDEAGPPAVALTIETGPDGGVRPAVYLRNDGTVKEHLLQPDLLHDFGSDDHRKELTSILKEVGL